MAVAIRLRRAGAKKNPFYHVVATSSRNARDGKFLEKLGHYDPRAKPAVFTVNQERLQYWVKQGACFSETVGQLVAKQAKSNAAAE